MAAIRVKGCIIPKKGAANTPRLPLTETVAVLLDLDFGAGLLELLGDLLGLVLGDGFLDLLGSAVDHVLGVLEAKTGYRADLLDDGDLVRASGLEDDVELRLLLGRSGASGGTRDCDCGGGGNAPRLFESLDELARLD